MQLTFGSPCVSQIVTSDPNVLVDYKINPGAQGINFQSNTPITITIQFNCNIQIMYMCIPGSTTNVASFTYTLQDVYNNPVASGTINSYGLDQCTPHPLNIVSPATQLTIKISQTIDGQTPYRVVLDIQGCYISTVSRKHHLLVALYDNETNIHLFFFSDTCNTNTTTSCCGDTSK
jgi:hypothetical protein